MNPAFWRRTHCHLEDFERVVRVGRGRRRAVVRPLLRSFALLRSVAMGAERCVLRDLLPAAYALFSCATLPAVNRIAVHKERENQEQKDEQYNNQTQECNLHYDYDRCAIHDFLLALGLKSRKAFVAVSQRRTEH